MPQFNSQYGEDRLLSLIFSGKKGTCAEIGALDGLRHSNTFYFEQQGWECLLVEPNPASCEAIRSRRNCVLFECAVSDTTGTSTFIVSDEVPELSGFQPFVNLIERDHGTTREVEVRVRTLDDILNEANIGPIDFISIDVEGHELSVLRGFSLEKWKPRIVILEDASEGTDNSIALAMKAAGYVPWRMTGANLWFSHEADAELVSKGNLRSFYWTRAMRRLRHAVRPWLIEPIKKIRNSK